MAEYKIIADSSCELPEQYKKDDRFCLVPFRIEIDGVPYRDTEAINIKNFLDRIVNSKSYANSACPAPDAFYRCIEEGNQKRVYIITISSKLSSCYISAMMAKKMYEESHSDKEIFVIDSKSVACAESQLALHAMELEESGASFDEITEKLTEYRDKVKTVFVLNNLEAAYKNIKFPKLTNLLATANNVRSVFTGEKLEAMFDDKKIMVKATMNQMTDRIAEVLKDASEQTRIVITHCNNLIEAEKLRDMIMEKTGLSNIVIMSSSAINSFLANEGGIIVSF